MHLPDNLIEDMSPLPVFNRGFGGSRCQDVIDKVQDLVLRHSPTVIVWYCGVNDIHMGGNVEACVAGFREFVNIVQGELPDTSIIYLAINRCPLHRQLGLTDLVECANRRIRDYAESTPGVEFVDPFVRMPRYDAAVCDWCWFY